MYHSYIAYLMLQYLALYVLSLILGYAPIMICGFAFAEGMIIDLLVLY